MGKKGLTGEEDNQYEGKMYILTFLIPDIVVTAGLPRSARNALIIVILSRW